MTAVVRLLRNTLVLSLFVYSCSQQAVAADVADALRVLSREKSTAENEVTRLTLVRDLDLRAYSKGIKAYSLAQGEFNGLIDQLRQQLREDESIADSPVFRKRLIAAVDQRLAFSQYVDETSDKLLGEPSGGEKGVPVEVTINPAELVAALSDAGLQIWQAYHAVNEQRRMELMEDLDRLRWKSFASLTN